ncbi:IS66 family insertion sequence element accessory protein TnpB [Shewanella psychromarinicola]|uniref:Transposase n=1 Tax=Shewanella psychromarinicola TaxID=2487742 RepID=A0ABM7BZ23_9GAMM|nr:IS66 family insertion sequence element accessory protein TnpB [Shewanella psychromarinicola]AZG35090.1 transposase [Shewanella psychromarinicola]AZG35109.1 transposase [Shewanella psychromarinicola]AZG35144.1 transposase [Shewanella psychromarinicola]AZG36510.1 transposase [Shewanella psychromarinicola]
MTPHKQIYLVTGHTDMRKAIDGLSLIVSDVLEMDPLNQAWFIFCNRDRDKIKILFWDTNGFWLYYRRLEKGRFKWPGANDEQDALTINQHQLNWLLSGLSLEVSHGHKPLNGLTVR